MQADYIELIEPTPRLKSKRCRLIALLIRVLLQFTTLFIAVLSWYFYDLFIAIALAILSFIVMGIVRSKLRNSVIPPSQREYQYNDQGIADWYTAKEFCFEEEVS